MRWRRSSDGLRVGWVGAATLTAPRSTFRGLETSVAMRIANVGRWLNRHTPLRTEMYRRDGRYDVVVFVKAMDGEAQEEARRVQGRGGRVVFDANVNYYELWGDYELPNTRPTPEQQRAAIAMTERADAVVADSSYLLDIVRRFNERSVWIPDNVDMRLFRRPRRHQEAKRLRLVWSGRAAKAAPLSLLLDLSDALEGYELLVVAERAPELVDELQRALPTSFVPFELRRYARLLRRCDVVISPKRLVNGYEVGHTEWKIALGMAAGVPALASPQRSYVEALAGGGGLTAASADDWRRALLELRDVARRTELGRCARKTVQERYSTPVVAARYGELLASLA